MIQDVASVLKSFFSNRDVYCYGAGIYGHIVVAYATSLGKKIKGVLVSDNQSIVQDNQFKIQHISEIENLASCGILLAVGESAQKQILPSLLQRKDCADLLLIDASWIMDMYNKLHMDKIQGRCNVKELTVCYFTHYNELYGANLSLLEDVTGMQKRFHVRPIVITLGVGKINHVLNELGIINFAFEFSFWVQKNSNTGKYIDNNDAIKAIVKIISQFKVDIIHTNSTVIDIGAKVAQILDRPHIWHLREFLEEDYDLSFILSRNVSIQFMEQTSEKMVFISRKLLDKYHSLIHDKNKAALIYSGVNEEHYYVKRQGFEYQADCIDVVVCGLIIPNKNQMEVLQAVSLLPDLFRQQIKVHFFGQGDTSYIAALEDFIRVHKLEQQVIFHGYTTNVYAYIKNYHIGIMPSKCEAFGRVTVEYMMAGDAVIVSDTGANPELVDFGKCGLIYRLGDVQELCNKILLYMEDRKLLYRNAVLGQQYAKKKFSYQRKLDDLYALYNAVLRRDWCM